MLGLTAGSYFCHCLKTHKTNRQSSRDKSVTKADAAGERLQAGKY